MADFLEDAEAAGYTLKVRESFEDAERSKRNRSVVTLSRGYRDFAWIHLWFDGVKWRFGRGEPVGGAKVVEDFWTMKGLRKRFSIPPRS